MNVTGIEEAVTDKGYHSGAVVQRMKAYGVRSYIAEKKQKGRRKWAGKPAESILFPTCSTICSQKRKPSAYRKFNCKFAAGVSGCRPSYRTFSIRSTWTQHGRDCGEADCSTSLAAPKVSVALDGSVQHLKAAVHRRKARFQTKAAGVPSSVPPGIPASSDSCREFSRTARLSQRPSAEPEYT